ncbi:tetratricopeptide repeat protein [Marinoscillum pacificum]|uniref:tetratricopeptide repeat protein n=1 Tax=Marinoscillum pacificum TaxID=392723 RepID=UPI0021572CBB|nr:tetratricopeptide repeat protein [Marinoscillum pacificum]
MKLFIYLMLIACSSLIMAQRPDFESLKQAISKAETDEAKLRAFNQYGDALPNDRHAEVLSIADSLEIVAQTANDPKLLIASSNFLHGVGYFKAREYAKSKPYLQKAANLYHEMNDEIEFRALNVLGLSYIRLREVDSSIYLYNKILETLPNTNIQGKISTHGNLGSSYRQSGNYAKALEHLEAAYRLDSMNAFTQINTAMNIAHIYNEMEMYDQAISTLKKVAINNAPPIPPKAVYYNNLAISYSKNGQLDSAFQYFTAGRKIAQDVKYPSGEFTAISNLVECNLELEQFDKIPELLSDLKNLIPVRPMDGDFRFHFLNGQYLLKTEKYNDAIDALLLGETATNKPPLSNMKPAIYHALIDAYTALDSLKLAKEYINKLDRERESPANSKRERFLAEAKANYLLAVTEAELDDKNKEVVESSNKVIIFGGAAALLMIVAFILFRINQKSNETLVSQEQEKADLQKEIEKQRTQIIELKSKAILEAQEIVSIKSDGHYLEFSLKNKPKPEVDRNKLKDILEVLPDFFIQIHRSYIINIKEVRVKFADKVEMKNGEELPVSRKFKEEFNEAIKKFE